jgi:flagellar basal body-associated protein FliL
MANEKTGSKKPEEALEEAVAAVQPSRRVGVLSGLLSWKWLAVFVVASLAAHGAGFAYYHFRGPAPAVAPASPEVSLGAFHFEADAAEPGRPAKADFSLYVALIEPVDQAARQRLESRKVRVRQDVEELLRKAHGGDFDDPGMKDLKRQLQEQIGQTLGMRTISDVMITDLIVHRAGRANGTVATSTELPTSE